MVHRVLRYAVPIALALSIVGTVGARADIISLANGRAVKGEVVEEDERFVTVKMPRGSVRLPRSAVVSIERQSRADLAAGNAREMLRMRRYDEAISILEDAAASEEDRGGVVLGRMLAEAWRAKAEHLLEARRYRDAASALNESLKHSPDPSGPEVREMLAKIEAGAKKAAELEDTGRKAIDRGDLDAAAEALDAASAIGPDSDAAVSKLLGIVYVRLGMRALQTGDLKTARQCFERAMVADRSTATAVGDPYAECVMALAAKRLSEGDAGGAAAGIEAAMKFIPDNEEILVIAGRLAESKGDTAAAAGFYSRALSRRSPEAASPEAVAALRMELDARRNRRPGAERFQASAQRHPPDEIAAAKDFSTYESPRFVIYHRDARLAARCAAELERILSRLLAEMTADGAPPWMSKPAVFLHATKEEYMAATGQPAWTEGFSRYAASGLLTSASMHSWASSPRLTGSVLPHELTHLVFSGIMPNREKIPRAIHEGVAVFQETDDRRVRLLHLLRSKVGSGEYIPLRRLLGLPDYPSDPDMFYAEAYALTAYLIERKGMAAFLNACKRFSGEDAWREVAESAGFRDIESLERDLISRLTAGTAAK